MNKNPTISLVVPCYNEEIVIEIFLEHIEPILDALEKSYEIIFVNDGSTDDTFNVLIHTKEKHKNIRILNLSRNFGKEAVLTAGV